ncbi:hypothetical protein Q666_13815 [Marinobacter sp. ES-1]|nr:hypothetical protein Q666_13815 [Marinobacter sp. ES-1]
MIDCDKTWVSIQKTLEINDHKDHYFRLWVLFNIQGALVRKSVDEDLSFDPEAIPGHA